MKRSKRIYILLGILAVICIATFGVMQYEEKQEQIRNSDEIVLELDIESVDSLAWEYDMDKETKEETDEETEDETEDGTEEESTAVSLAFHKDEDATWLYDDDEAFPVDEEKITALLEQFEAFGVAFIIEEVEDYAQYGLDDPICTISLTVGEEEYEIQLGNYSNLDAQRYVSIGDGNVYLAASDPMEQYEVVLSDMIKHDTTPTLTASAATVTQIQFEGEQSYSIAYEEENAAAYSEDDVYYAELDGETLVMDSTNINSYLRVISYLDLSEYVTYNATEEELESYGLDDPQLSVTVDYTYLDEEEEEISDTFVLHVSRDPEELAAAEEAEAEDAESEDTTTVSTEEETVTAYARVGESQIVYQITAEDYEDLMAASANDLRYQDVFIPDFSEVYQIDISLEGNVYSLEMTEEDEVQTWYYKDEEIDVSSVRSALKALEADGFTDEQPSQQEEISITVYLNNENYPKILLEIYRYDGQNCLAAVDGEPLCFTARSDVVDLIESIQAIVLN